VARILPTVVVLALLGCTAAAFAVTESLKLERSPVFNTHVGKVVAPDSLANATVPIAFQLRKPDRVTVDIVNGAGGVVRVLAQAKPAPRGTVQFTWNGRDDSREVVPDGTYRPRVHLAREHRTILLPNPIRMDATPPLIRLDAVAPRVLWPNAKHSFVRIRYRTNERARAILYVDGDRKTFVRRYARAGKFDWHGRSARYLRAGPHRLRLRGFDLATNVGPPSRSLTIVVRYVELRPRALHVKTGRRFGFRVLTGGVAYTVHLGSLHERRSGALLILRAAKPGRYVLRVNAHGHVARAVVVVTR
jgi:hypothetical protein